MLYSRNRLTKVQNYKKKKNILKHSLEALLLTRVWKFVGLQVDFTAKPVFWKDLTAPLKDKCGHLLTSLSYNPMTNNLTLGIIEARNLKAMDINGKSGESVVIVARSVSRDKKTKAKTKHRHRFSRVTPPVLG